MSTDKFSVINADPPWRFDDRGSRIAPDHEGKHYNTMSEMDILKMGSWVRRMTEHDAALFLWCPHAMVLDGTAGRVCNAWGFVPKQEIVWIKTKKDGGPILGMGHYTRTCTEPMILATRGRMAKKVKRHDVPNVLFAERQKHSKKPPNSYLLIESLFDGPYLELFARERFSAAWDVWGNEIENTVERKKKEHAEATS